MSEQNKKIKLFDSDGEEDTYDDFQVRPQYEGPHGQQILEINSQLSKRFKLDERFAEDFDSKIVEEEKLSGESEERQKNIRILETVLGHEVGKNFSDKSFKRKQIRFDPDDENASKLIKTSQTILQKEKKSKKKKNTVSEEKIEQNIPLSTDRFIEVCPDLKEILNSASPFKFSEKFNCDVDETENSCLDEVSILPKITKELESKSFQKKIDTQMPITSIPNLILKSRDRAFFIANDDPRFKEGIEFFKRPKPLEEIRKVWEERRKHVLELFRMKKRSSQRSHSAKVQSVQMKNTIRRNNFKK